MNRVLVVGGGGFIGAHLLRSLAKSGTVFATRRPGATSTTIAGVEWLDSDVATADATAGWPVECDTVIYLAQSRQWRSFPDGAKDSFAINVAGVFHAAEYARACGASRFLYLSSGSVYPKFDGAVDEALEFPVPSEQPFYPATKLAAEILLGPYASAFPVITLRLFVPYGEGQDPLMLMPQLVRRVRAGEAVMLDGDDGLRVNPIAVSDVVETLVRCMVLDHQVTLNVAGPNVLTLREVATAIGNHVGRAPVFERRGTTAGAVIANTELLESTLGWRPSRGLAQGLKEWLG